MGVKLPRHCPRCAVDTTGWTRGYYSRGVFNARRVKRCDKCGTPTKPSRKRKPRRKATPRTKLRRECDALWRSCVQAKAKGGLCDCGCGKPGNQAHHIFAKGGHPRVRYVVANGAWLWMGCHRRIQNDHEENRQLGLWLMGGSEGYADVMMLAHATGPRQDLEQVRAELQERLLALTGAPLEAE